MALTGSHCREEAGRSGLAVTVLPLVPVTERRFLARRRRDRWSGHATLHLVATATAATVPRPSAAGVVGGDGVGPVANSERFRYRSTLAPCLGNPEGFPRENRTEAGGSLTVRCTLALDRDSCLVRALDNKRPAVCLLVVVCRCWERGSFCESFLNGADCWRDLHW